MKVTKLILIGLILICSSSLMAQPNPAIDKKANTKTILKIEADLKNIEASINVTKSKIKLQKEIQYSADLYNILAELYHDKASLLISLKREKNIDAPIEELDFVLEKRIYQDAIDNYRIIEERYPKYTELDRVLYTIAQEYKILNVEKETLSYLKKITERYPESRYAIKAHIEIGDIFFNRKDYIFALAQYEKVVSKAEEPELSLAHYKIGWCLIHSENWLKSLLSFEKAIKVRNDNDNADSKNNIKEDALVASVWPYSELSTYELASQKNYQKPLDYYKSIADDKALYRTVLLRLAQRLELKKRYADASDAAIELFRLTDKVREKKTALEIAYTISKKYKRNQFPPWFITEFRELILSMRRQHDDAQMLSEVEKFEVVFRDLVTTKNKTAESTTRQDDYKMAAEAYSDYLIAFPNAKQAAFMRLNRAEVLYKAGEYAQSGQTYFDLFNQIKNRKTKRKKEFLESSLDAFLKGASDTSELTLDRFQSRDGYREVADVYRKVEPQNPKNADIKFNVAKTYYDEQKFDIAADRFFEFIKSYANSEKRQEAVLLYLDCYYLRQQLKAMSKAAKRLLQLNDLSKQLIATIKNSSTQARMNAMKSLAGDFYSKKYAKKFKDFAIKNKNTKIGEQALYEAFISLRSQGQMQIFEVGEEYIATYENSVRAKEILLSLIQMSLLYLDYPRAAAYMGTYAQRYSQDSGARSLAQQAAQIYGYYGNLEEATAAYSLAGESMPALKLLFSYGAWDKLSKAAASVEGLASRYYQSLSLLRMGQVSAANPLLLQVAQANSAIAEEKEMIAHASIILAEIELDKFKKINLGDKFSPQIIQSKSAQYQEISNVLQNGVNSGGGSWVIGSLYNLGRLNRYFADFIKKIRPPDGMSPAQLQEIVRPQIQEYEKTSKQNFALCLKLAEENEIPSKYVVGCRKETNIYEINDQVLWSTLKRSPASIPEKLKADLIKSPRSTQLLKQLAEVNIKDGSYQNALLILFRAAEIDPEDSTISSYLGVTYLNMKDYLSAQNAFQKALEKNPLDPLANRGMAGIAKAFGYNSKYQLYRKKSGETSVVGSTLHPWLK